MTPPDESPRAPRRLLIAGGGTGGHVYPGLAIAEEARAGGAEVLFVGTARGLESRVVPAAGFELELIEVSGLKRMGAAAMARGLARLPLALGRSMAILRRYRPDVVLGVGGYASGPVVLAGALAGCATAIQEQNSVPGFTNRALGRFAGRVFIAFEEAGSFFPPAKVMLLGNPVRRSFVEAAPASGAEIDVPRLLIVGGSQGARAVNDLVIEAATLLARAGTLPPTLHQTGAADADRCAERYRASGLQDRVEVRPFIEDMAAALRAASLVVGRAGALTLAELAVARKPALLIPLPTAADDHQRRNAEAFGRKGAALVIDQRTATAKTLTAALADLLADAPRRRAMAAAMGAQAHPDAAALICRRLATMQGR